MGVGTTVEAIETWMWPLLDGGRGRGVTVCVQGDPRGPRGTRARKGDLWTPYAAAVARGMSPGSQFCSFCGTYLGWQEQSGASPEIPDKPPPQKAQQPHVPPAHSQETAFRASTDNPDVTVPVDGTPVRVPVDISNTSTIVDGYAVEAMNAPAWLEVVATRVELLPGTQERVHAQLRVNSRTLVPAQRVRLSLRVRNTTGSLGAQDIPLEVVVPALSVPVELRAEPTLLRTRDLAAALCTIVVDNSRGNTWALVRMSASDPEDIVDATWSLTTVQVAPGEEARTEVQFAAPPPDPGGEVSRTITVAAQGDGWTATTTVTLVQVASAGADGPPRAPARAHGAAVGRITPGSARGHGRQPSRSQASGAQAAWSRRRRPDGLRLPSRDAPRRAWPASVGPGDGDRTSNTARERGDPGHDDRGL